MPDELCLRMAAPFGGRCADVMARVLLGIAGCVVALSGALLGMLGVWGVSRGSSASWLLALIGLLGVGAGVWLVVRGLMSSRRADP